MRRDSEADYWEALRETGERAASVVEEIYGDLQERTERLRSIESGQQKALAKLVEGLYFGSFITKCEKRDSLKRKITRLSLALAMCLTLSLPAMAAKGTNKVALFPYITSGEGLMNFIKAVLIGIISFVVSLLFSPIGWDVPRRYRFLALLLSIFFLGSETIYEKG